MVDAIEEKLERDAQSFFANQNLLEKSPLAAVE